VAYLNISFNGALGGTVPAGLASVGSDTMAVCPVPLWEAAQAAHCVQPLAEIMKNPPDMRCLPCEHVLCTPVFNLTHSVRFDEVHVHAPC